MPNATADNIVASWPKPVANRQRQRTRVHHTRNSRDRFRLVDRELYQMNFEEGRSFLRVPPRTLPAKPTVYRKNRGRARWPGHHLQAEIR